MYFLNFLALAALAVAGLGASCAPAAQREGAPLAGDGSRCAAGAHVASVPRSVFGGDSPSSRTAPMVITGSTRGVPSCEMGVIHV